MATTENDPKDLEAAKAKGYELKDVSASPVAVAIAALIVLMFAGFVGGYAFKVVFEATEVKSRPEASPLSQREPVKGPLLQAHPEVELEDYLEGQERVLSSYAWIDRDRKIVRIPIERAMQIVARDGFPKWESQVAKLEEEPEPAPEPEAVEEPAEPTADEASPAEAAPSEDETEAAE